MWGGWDRKLCLPSNSMGSQQVPHEPALQLSMDPSPRGFATKKKDLDEAEVWAGMYQMDLHWEKETS